ncbi:hypothetical protein SAMN06265784_104359 [Paraburkholderia susongensis]|uniref:Transmembrane protein n=1 Tax=Paraburkholderia susongensis TaxID=1515439 RepID=A0A1X7KV20_9BURK|nr:hypothetical protein SAMN06265784_104359 [Paraburkholderia susongensis]
MPKSISDRRVEGILGLFCCCSCGVGLSLFSCWGVGSASFARLVFFVPAALAFPCFLVGLLVLPLCGAAPTFFAAAKKVGKESSFTPLILKWVPWLGGGSGASGICVPAHSAVVTRQSFFRRRCARRPPVQKPSVFFGASPRRSRWPSRSKARPTGFPCRPVRDARSAEWERMMSLSPTRNVRGHRFQMHHCPLQARGPT